MFRRVLIANRGEIAVRIARSVHALGLEAVGVYSEPDAGAPHVGAMDRAVALGGASAADSYLDGDAVVRAALRTECDALHPGYGFLAENAAFARQVVASGLVWVGPTPDQIALLGDKVAAKQAAAAAGVPTTPIVACAPGHLPDACPMPALVKAAAGGGGRGMRVVRDAASLAEAVEAAAREAAAAFGDDTVFIEPYLERARHIEVQVFGDEHGNVIHLGERECSIQRRNQKILEESPAVAITAETRATVCDGALALARHVGYQNAGTVEFLVAADGTVNFLEVNTRLQVEHPVTEAVTGIDLVALQLRIAAGEPLPLDQDMVVMNGHAIEARLVAEDPAAGWLPATGIIFACEVGPGVRVDAGVEVGTEVTANYDSLLAKVISFGATREDAARRLAQALRSAKIAGVKTNLHSLVAILEEPDFLAADAATSYLDEHPEVVAASGPQADDRLALLVGAVYATERRDRGTDMATGFAPSGWRNVRTRGQRQIWTAGDDRQHVEYVMESSSAARMLIGAWPQPREDGSLAPDDRRECLVRLRDLGDGRHVVEIDGLSRAVEVMLDGDTAHTFSSVGGLTWTLAPRFALHDAVQAGSGPICPLPGTVIAIHVADGQTVVDGEALMVIEAMKMEHTITAVGDATVVSVRFAVGDRVDAGDLLVELRHEEA